MSNRKLYLSKHPYAIWQSKDGKYWYTNLPDLSRPRGTRQIRRDSKRELEDAIIEYWENASENGITVGEVYEQWSRNRLETKRIIIATYVNINSTFNTHFQDLVDRPMASIKPIEWCDFLEQELHKHRLTKVMFGTLKSLVIGMIKWAYKRDLIEYSPSSINDLLDIPERAYYVHKKTDDEDVYNEEETLAVMNYLFDNKDDDLNVGLLLMFVSGIRIGELLSLKYGDFNGCKVSIRRTITISVNESGKIARIVKDSPKTEAGIRDVIIPESFKWICERFSNGEPDDFVFKSRHGKLVKYDTLNLRLKKACVIVGIPFRSTHKIRKTYASILLDNNVSKRFIMKQVGHSDIACTENYYHRERKDESQQADIINGIQNFNFRKEDE